MSDHGLVSTVVAVVGSRVEAEMIASMLRTHGIHATVSGDDVGGIDLALQAQGVRVMAPDGKADEARRLIGGVHGSRPEDVHLNAFQRLMVRILGGPASKA
jgi:Putative prokaryotic signal transducing protein